MPSTDTSVHALVEARELLERAHTLLAAQNAADLRPAAIAMVVGGLLERWEDDDHEIGGRLYAATCLLNDPQSEFRSLLAIIVDEACGLLGGENVVELEEAARLRRNIALLQVNTDMALAPVLAGVTDAPLLDPMAVRRAPRAS